MTMTAMRMNARASTVMTSTTRRMVLLPSRRHDGLARFRLARRLRDARTRAESSSSDDTAVDERRSEELASSSSLSSRRTILGVERSTGEAIRDWDECVEWRERKPPSDETLGLLDASILALALPGVAELLLDPVMGAVDTAFIGKLTGPNAAEALGGLAVSTTCFTFCFKLFNFLAVVTGPLVAAKISSAGGRDSVEGRRAAKKTVGSAMALALALGFATTGVLEVFTDQMLQFCGAHHDVLLQPSEDLLPAADVPTVKGLLEYGESYLRIRALSLPACLIVMVGVGAFRGLLDTKTALNVAILTEIFHLGLDPILIYGFGPIEGMDVAGAAIATTVAEWVGALWFWKLMMDEEILDFASVFRLPDQNDADLGVLVAGSTSQLARTVLLQTVLVRATATASMLSVAGAHQVCLQVWWITLFGLDAVAVSAQALVAASLGKNDVVGARIAADRALSWGIGAGVLVGAVVFVTAPSLPFLFTNDAEIAAEAVMPIRILALLQPLNSAVFVGDGVFQGSSDFDYLAKAMAISAGGGILALGVAGQVEGATLTSVWLGMATLMMGRAATLGWRYYKDESSPMAVSPAECVVFYGDLPENDDESFSSDVDPR